MSIINIDRAQTGSFGGIIDRKSKKIRLRRRIFLLFPPVFLESVLTNTKPYRMVYRMKVTAIIADELISNVKEYTRSSTVTEAITIALKDWIDMYKIKELNKKISQNPINIDNITEIREVNRSV